jgi:hypothetical protein
MEYILAFVMGYFGILMFFECVNEIQREHYLAATFRYLAGFGCLILAAASAFGVPV